jgi:hypothetical protein
MAKRGFIVLVLAAFVAGGLFAQEDASPAPAKKSFLSLGAGGLFVANFGGGISQVLDYTYPNVGGGGYLFFDAKYAELTVGMEFDSGKQWIGALEVGKYSLLNLSFGLFGKYPIPLTLAGVKVLISPMAGIEYNAALSGKFEATAAEQFWGGQNGDFEEAGDWSALWIKGGAGVDWDVQPNVYLRLEALFGFRTANKGEKEAVDHGASAITQIGATAKIAAGFKL